jgi:hypothetical protein
METPFLARMEPPQFDMVRQMALVAYERANVYALMWKNCKQPSAKLYKDYLSNIDDSSHRNVTWNKTSKIASGLCAIHDKTYSDIIYCREKNVC